MGNKASAPKTPKETPKQPTKEAPETKNRAYDAPKKTTSHFEPQTEKENIVQEKPGFDQNQQKEQKLVNFDINIPQSDTKMEVEGSKTAAPQLKESFTTIQKISQTETKSSILEPPGDTMAVEKARKEEEDLEDSDYINKTDYIFLLDKISELSKIVRILGRRVGEIEDKLDISFKPLKTNNFNALRSMSNSEKNSPHAPLVKKSCLGGRGKRDGSFSGNEGSDKSLNKTKKPIQKRPRKQPSALNKLAKRRQKVKELKILHKKAKFNEKLVEKNQN